MKISGIIVSIIILSSLLAFDEKETLLPDAASLGRMLFFERLLSLDKTISCGSCHKANFAFADTSAVSLGIKGRRGKRNTPSAMNVSLQSFYFWDGRARTLEEQALIPIENPDEMGVPVKTVIARLKADRFYRQAFQSVFHEPPTAQNLGKALAAFERTLETNNSPFDDWRMNENANAVTDEAKRGFALFNGKGKCVKCHLGADFQNDDFRNIGLFNGKNLADSGRGAITHSPGDVGKFKIGALRNVARTAPYMHNGMFRTLAEVIDYYNEPDKVVPDAIGRDSLLSKPLGLTNNEKKDLEAFLNSLTERELQ
jgi:cytochrome c peroxidase